MPHGRVAHADGSPVAGVAVASGADVVRTGQDGRFRFGGGGDFVVLARPEGYTADPWYHLAGEGPADFTLRPIPGSDRLRLLHVTDLHMSSRPSAPGMEVPTDPGQLADALDRLLAAHGGVSLLVATGDLTDTGLDSEYDMVAKVMDGLPMEVVAVPGNHDHMGGEPRFLITECGYGTNHGDPDAWERNFGPRWFSLDRGGLHLVVVDWHMWELGRDRDIQDRWVAADLARHRDSPWVLFSHDQMPEGFFDRLRPPVATFSGHWHTTRDLRIGSTAHVNTPPLTFGGLDFSRPGAGFAEWDGSKLTVERHGDPLPALPPPRLEVVWSSKIGSRGGLAAPVVLRDQILCGVAWDDDGGKGRVVAVDASTGSEVWSIDDERAFKSTPVVAGDRLVVADVAAGVLVLDAEDGSILWRAEPVSPLRTWCWTSPVAAGDLVVVSSPTRVAAYRLQDGELAWERTGLAPHSNLVSLCTPAIFGDTIVVGFWPFSPCFFGLDARSGRVLWSVDDPEGGELEGSTGRGTALGSWSPVGPGVTDSGKAIFPTSAGWAAVDVVEGKLLWRTPDEGRFRPGRPAIAGEGTIVTTPDGVRRLRASDGEIEWAMSFPSGEGVALAPYRATPHVGTAGASVIGDLAVVPGLDGSLHRFDVVTGADMGRLEAGIRSAASPLTTSDLVVLSGLDGTLLALLRDEVAA